MTTNDYDRTTAATITSAPLSLACSNLCTLQIL